MSPAELMPRTVRHVVDDATWCWISHGDGSALSEPDWIEYIPAPVVCSECNDTHQMGHAGWMCTRCPAPCDRCAYGAFCRVTPCACDCHPESASR